MIGGNHSSTREAVCHTRWFDWLRHSPGVVGAWCPHSGISSQHRPHSWTCKSGWFSFSALRKGWFVFVCLFWPSHLPMDKHGAWWPFVKFMSRSHDRRFKAKVLKFSICFFLKFLNFLHCGFWFLFFWALLCGTVKTRTLYTGVGGAAFQDLLEESGPALLFAARFQQPWMACSFQGLRGSFAKVSLPQLLVGVLFERKHQLSEPSISVPPP